MIYFGYSNIVNEKSQQKIPFRFVKNMFTASLNACETGRSGESIVSSSRRYIKCASQSTMSN